MRKFIASLVLASLMLIAVPLAAEAHNGCRRHRKTTRSYASQRYYAPQRYYYAQPQRPSFYRRHRNLINVGIATGAGAGIGALAGGKRGALIGTAAGAGLGALYTYVLKAKKRRY